MLFDGQTFSISCLLDKKSGAIHRTLHTQFTLIIRENLRSPGEIAKKRYLTG
jgi:hypothetical protein